MLFLLFFFFELKKNHELKKNSYQKFLKLSVLLSWDPEFYCLSFSEFPFHEGLGRAFVYVTYQFFLNMPHVALLDWSKFYFFSSFSDPNQNALYLFISMNIDRTFLFYCLAICLIIQTNYSQLFHTFIKMIDLYHSVSCTS